MYGRTPLVYAVWNGQVAVVELLVRAGARINLADDIGGTPLSYAVCNGHTNVLKLLFKKGTKPIPEDDALVTLLLSAADKGREDVVKLLLETGKVNPDLEDSSGNNRKPLSCAVEGSNVAVVQLLLAEGVKLDYNYKIVSEFNHLNGY